MTLLQDLMTVEITISKSLIIHQASSNKENHNSEGGLDIRS